MFDAIRHRQHAIAPQQWGCNCAAASVKQLHQYFLTGEKGLADIEARERLRQYGPNRIPTEVDHGVVFDLLRRFANPLTMLLFVVASLSFFFGGTLSALIITCMILMSVTLSYFQEHRAKKAAAQLHALVQTTCTVVRDGAEAEIPLVNIVPGDTVKLSSGDIVPADMRILANKDMFVNQSSLTGESLPVEKTANTQESAPGPSPELANMAFMGSSVVSGFGTGIVVHTGPFTELGKLSATLLNTKKETLFDRQIKDFTMLMIRSIVIVVCVVLGIYALKGQNFLESFLYALALAVQITPETLPMIVTINLSKGALAMAKKKVIVKQLFSIQNFGAMDVLCSDKTGTLTLNEVVLEKHINVHGNEDEGVFTYGYLNSFYQTGTKNILKTAVLKHDRSDLHAYRKVDEVPFDFERKMTSVVVDLGEKEILIAVGAPEEVIKRCVSYEDGTAIMAIKRAELPDLLCEYDTLSKEGFRVLAVAYRAITQRPNDYTADDEHDLVLKGYMAFLDPAKPLARAAIGVLGDSGIDFKIITGDSELVTKKICGDLGIPIRRVVLGSEMDGMSDGDMAMLAETATIFARIAPAQKERIIRCLRSGGHTVGYLGDGINDALALKAADIGISVNNAVDVAKESASIILLEKDLGVLADGVLEGRRVFGNFLKYIRMTSTVNLSYMLSSIGASLILPFLPMAPVQLLLNNYLYEVGQTAIPGDTVDEEYQKKPRKWSIRSVIKFMLCAGPMSSAFDFITFGMLWWVFGAYADAAMFQTGWFLEATLVQMLIIFAIRTKKIPFIQSRPSAFLIGMAVLIIGIVFVLPFTALAPLLHLVRMPVAFYACISVIALGYIAAIWLVKNLVAARIGDD
jgi:P-type Mg2+ transporter